MPQRVPFNELDIINNFSGDVMLDKNVKISIAEIVSFFSYPTLLSFQDGYNK